jgi:hypothetical protein
VHTGSDKAGNLVHVEGDVHILQLAQNPEEDLEMSEWIIAQIWQV